MPVTRELDVRPLPPPRRHPEIFGVFDALKADEAYPMADQAAGNDRARDDLVKRLQAF